MNRDEEDAIMEAVAQSTMEEDQKHIEEVMKEESEKKEEEKKEGEVKEESEVKKPKEGEVKEGEVKEGEVKESEVKKPKEGEVKAGEVKKLKEGEEVKVNEPTPETIMEDEEDMKVNRIFERISSIIDSNYIGESVSLGLGDFIFYSLMVSKASLSSSVPFVIVFIIILSVLTVDQNDDQGLLITMALLSILEMPLPALPFSMILGVTAYALAYFVMTSMMNQFALSGIMF